MPSLDEKLLNAKLPASVYRLCPEIPAELQTAVFDPVEYVNGQLKDKQFSAELLNGLISEVDGQIHAIDAQIEELICGEGDLQLPEMEQTSKLFDELQEVQKKVQETQTHSAAFIEKMNRFNTARRQIDYLAMSVEFCKEFQRLCVQFQAPLPQDAQEQAQMMRLYATACCINQYLIALEDVQQLQQSFKLYKVFQEAVKQMKPSQSHTQDAFSFWSVQSSKFGFLLGQGSVGSFYDEVSGQILQEGFSELQGDGPLTQSFLTKFEMFFKAHSQYMRDFERAGLREVLQGRAVYFELLKAYGQGRETPIHAQKPELYCVDEDALLKKYNLFEHFFAYVARVIKKKLETLLPTLNQENTVKQLKLVEKLEAIFTQDKGTGIQANQLTEVFNQKGQDMLGFTLQQLEQGISQAVALATPPATQGGQSTKKVQDSKISTLFPEVKGQLQKLLSLLDYLPKRLDLPTALQISSRFFELITQKFVPALERRLDFSPYISQQVEKQTRFFKNAGFANFPELYKGTQQPLLQLETFRTTALIPLDVPSGIDAGPVQTAVVVMKIGKFLDAYFQSLETLLKQRVTDPAQQSQITDPYAFSEPQATFSNEYEAAFCSALVGQFIFQGLYAPQGRRAQAIIAARDVFLNQFREAVDGLREFYEEDDLEMLRLSVYNALLEQVGGFVVGNVQKEGVSSDDFQSLKKALEAMAAELNGVADALFKKLCQILLVKTMRQDGQEIDRNMFTKLMGDMAQDAPRWYDEVVTGYVRQ